MYACLFGHVSLQRKQDIRLAVVSTYRKLSKLVHVLKVNSRGFADDGDDGRSDDDNDGNDDYRGSRGSQDGSEDEDEGSVLVVYLRLGASKISESARRRAAEFSQGLFSELPSAFQLYRHVVMAGANGCDYLQAGKSLNVSQSHIIQAAKDLQAEGSIVTGKKSVRVSNVGVMFASAALATEWASSTHARGASAESAPAPWDCVRGEDVDDVDDEAKAANDRGVGERGCEGDTHREGEAGQPTVTQPAPPHTQPSVYKGATSHRPTRHVYTTCGW